VHIVAPSLQIGDLVSVEISDSGPNSLTGQLRKRIAA
jgi:tRNA-2-methylthio-N6-dimethylallyladenosine synthase